jgi:hypothetical protein
MLRANGEHERLLLVSVYGHPDRWAGGKRIPFLWHQSFHGVYPGGKLYGWNGQLPWGEAHTEGHASTRGWAHTVGVSETDTNGTSSTVGTAHQPRNRSYR